MDLRKTVFTIDYLSNLKTKTKCHPLENSSQSTASSGKVLPKKVLKIAGLSVQAMGGNRDRDTGTTGELEGKRHSK